MVVPVGKRKRGNAVVPGCIVGATSSVLPGKLRVDATAPGAMVTSSVIGAVRIDAVAPGATIVRAAAARG